MNEFSPRGGFPPLIKKVEKQLNLAQPRSFRSTNFVSIGEILKKKNKNIENIKKSVESGIEFEVSHVMPNKYDKIEYKKIKSIV